MNKINALVTTMMIFMMDTALACPSCMGSSPNDKYYLWVIGVFIVIIYFPMFYLFKTFAKFKSVNNTEVSSSNE